jgi:arginine/serine-rich splicing factor 17
MSAAAATATAIATLRPTEPFPLPSDLSLARRLKLLLSFSRADLSVSPVDEWQLKSALLAFLRNPPLSLSLLQDSDLSVSRLPDLQKRRREDPVSSGVLYVRDLSFLSRKGDGEAEEITQEQEEEKYLQWRSSLVEKLAGIELNLKGVVYQMSVEIPASDDFKAMKKSWEDFYASELYSSSMGLPLCSPLLVRFAGRWT